MHGRDGDTRSVPRELAENLLAQFGEDRTDSVGSGENLCRHAALNQRLRDDLLRHLHQSVDDKTRVAEELLAREAWDLLLVVFKEAHCAAHHCWPPGPELRGIYASLDAGLGRLLRFADRETTVLIFSDLGMSANSTANHLLDRILRRLERRFTSRGDDARIAADFFYRRVRRRLGRPATTSRHRLRCAFRAGGIYFARGPGIDADSSPRPVSIMDIGPTVGTLLNVRLPDVDGRPIAALVHETAAGPPG
ncbi:hypothetical protein BH24PSE2_BH24PSE2_20800 [soil metagenome]